MPVLHTPGSLVDRQSSVRTSVRRKLPTPPLTDPSKVDEHVRRTIERLRTQKAFRRHLGGAQNVGSDSDLSEMGVQNVVNSQIQSGTMFAPVVSVGSRDFQSRDIGTLIDQSMSAANVIEQHGVMRDPVDLVIDVLVFNKLGLQSEMLT